MPGIKRTASSQIEFDGGKVDTTLLKEWVEELPQAAKITALAKVCESGNYQDPNFAVCQGLYAEWEA